MLRSILEHRVSRLSGDSWAPQTSLHETPTTRARIVRGMVGHATQHQARQRRGICRLAKLELPQSLQPRDNMDELIAILLSVQDRMEALINQIDSGAVQLTETGPGSKDGNQNYLQSLRAQRDDLDKAIALTRNPQRKVY